MKPEISFWHNPRCSKSRAALALLEKTGHTILVRHYLKDGPTADEIKAVRKLLGSSARAMMRTGEALYKALNLQNETDDDRLIEAMAKNPILIERPIAICRTNAVIGRPPEKVLVLV